MLSRIRFGDSYSVPPNPRVSRDERGGKIVALYDAQIEKLWPCKAQMLHHRVIGNHAHKQLVQVNALVQVVAWL